VSLDLTEEDTLDKVFSWRSGEPIRLSYTPPFSEDESFEGTVLPRDLGLGGFANGTELFVHVSLEQESTLLSFRTGANRAANEVYAVRLVRANEADASSVCINESKYNVGAETANYRELYDDYESSLAKANLDGERSIPYTTWAARAANLISYMDSDIQSAGAGLPQLSPGARSLVASVTESHTNLSGAWSNFRSVSQRQSDSEWDDAWYTIYDAESALRVKYTEEVTEIVTQTCAELVQ
jgi:hypothetical protein